MSLVTATTDKNYFAKRYTAKNPTIINHVSHLNCV